MKISLDWLKDLVTFRTNDPEVIADALTRSTGEVEHIETQGALLAHCCIGKILTLKKHPNADKLSLCEVKTDRGVKRVVCGGTNLRECMHIAFAHAGATVKWHGGEMMTLAKTKIRGEESEGMICAAEELALAEMFPECTGHQIIDLGPSSAKATEGRDGDESVGTPLRTFLGLTDTIFHIDNHAITHRPDLFSHEGIARECVAIGLASWKKKREARNEKRETSRAPLPFRCINDIPALVPRYCSCTMEIDDTGETPDWMKKRLLATGWRSVNLPVDITNYVAMETGMPLHSFDIADIHGDVHMRKTHEGEWIQTLDAVERKLPADAMVMSDDKGVFDLLGIMGGIRSSTKDSTRRIYLHAAIVDPITIRRTIIATGHRTDASTVYEKGVPRVSAMRGLTRAIELFLELVPGARTTSRIEQSGTDGKAKSISLSSDHLTRVLGMDVPPKKVQRILTDLGFSVNTVKAKQKRSRSSRNEPTSNETSFAVTPPLWRLGDIHSPEDLVEEIGRIVGYNEVPSRLPEVPLRIPSHDARKSVLRDALLREGFFEILPLSLTGKAMLTKANLDSENVVVIENPLGEELSTLVPSVLPGLLTHAGKNLLRTEEMLKTFTLSHVFHAEREWEELGMLVAQRHKNTVSGEPFLMLKQSLVEALRAIGYAPSIHPSKLTLPFAHPGRSANLTICGKGIGTLCEILPDVSKRFDIPLRSTFAAINITALFEATCTEKAASPLPAFPAIVYDITIPMDHRKKSDELLRSIQGKEPLLESVQVTDLWSGPPLAPQQYKLTLRLTYRAKDRTLKEEEVRPIHEKIVQSIG